MSGATDVYAEVTATIVSALEQGTVPWRKPWRAVSPRHRRDWRWLQRSALADVQAGAHGRRRSAQR